jgi:alcohol dehydrogenase (cytochrome c)
MGRRPVSGGRKLVEGKDQFAVLRAIDPSTGERKWEHRYTPHAPNATLGLEGGIMTTTTGLVFTGDNEGWFYAFDASTGNQLWRFQMGAPLWGAAAISYVLDGRQWVVTPAGSTLTAFALPNISK